MPHPNEQLVHEWLPRRPAQTSPAMQAMLSDDVVWHVPGRNLLSRDYRGVAEVFAFFARVRELSGGTVRVEPLEFWRASST